MQRQSFKDYVLLREDKDPNKKPLGSKVSLGDNNDYEPFIVSDDSQSKDFGKNKNLAPIIRAFKKGANWGWSKDDKTGEDKPVKISGKKLFLTGSSVRDHLKGKTPKKIELTTNASPDEIYKILDQNEFSFVGTQEEAPKKSQKKVFWITKKNKSGRPFGFTIRIDGQDIELNPFTKNAKGRDPDDDYEIGTHEDDAASRDFAINAMSIPLTNDNGPNKDIVDFFGGMRDIVGGTISPIGDLNKSLEEDPHRGFRFIRMATRYGDPKNIAPDQKEALKALADKLKNGDLKIDPKKASDEFSDGVDVDDIDKRKYLGLYNSTGLSDLLFPGLSLRKMLPKELTELGDKTMPLAWMLQDNDPESVMSTIGERFKPDIVRKLLALLKSFGLSESIDADSLDDVLTSFMKSGIPGKKFKDWLTKIGGKNEDLANAFLEFSRMPRVRTIIVNDMGKEEPAKGFEDLFDPFSNKVETRAMPELEKRKKHFELMGFLEKLGQLGDLV